MTGWYKITPSGPITIGNLTPIGQNSGQVGCRWPPNGHHIAACIDLPSDCQIWGPFWGFEDCLHLVLPNTTYTTDTAKSDQDIPSKIYCLEWRDETWKVHPKHENQEIEIVGGSYLIQANDLLEFWRAKEFSKPALCPLPFETMVLSHNTRVDYQILDEGGFFAEMTTLMDTGWSILIKIIGDYVPRKWGMLGAGGTPVAITPLEKEWDWLGERKENANGAILLTGALWQKHNSKISCPTPMPNLKAYAAELGIPWQSWKSVKDRHDPKRRVQVLTPGEWLTPAGAVYLGESGSFGNFSGPRQDSFHRDALGYGHLLLFRD